MNKRDTTVDFFYNHKFRIVRCKSGWLSTNVCQISLEIMHILLVMDYVWHMVIWRTCWSYGMSNCVNDSLHKQAHPWPEKRFAQVNMVTTNIIRHTAILFGLLTTLGGMAGCIRSCKRPHTHTVSLQKQKRNLQTTTRCAKNHPRNHIWTNVFCNAQFTCTKRWCWCPKWGGMTHD